MSHEQSGPSKKEEHAPSSTNKEAGFSVPVDVQRIEVRLLKLLDEFNSGNILSFGPNCPYEKLDSIREKQEELMRLHFEQDKKIQTFISSGSSRGRRPVRSLLSEDGWKTTKTNVDALITRLDALSAAIDDLHNENRTG